VKEEHAQQSALQTDSTHNRRRNIELGNGKVTIDTASGGAVGSYLNTKWSRFEKKHGNEMGEYISEKMKHNFPKFFFFLIPLVALFLKLLFVRRRDCLFVHHAVFSLHIHSFFFSMLLLWVINPYAGMSTILGLLIFFGGVLYCTLAMKRVYTIGTARALFSTLFIGMGYSVCFGLVALASALLIIVFGG
jgi:hypothetical protein